jgi:F-type H+-transporting ATPase subunit epsilon
MPKLHLELTTPERLLTSQEADSVTMPTREGEITVLPGHVPLVGILSSGMMTVKRGDEEEYIAVSGGFVEVQPNGKIVILADMADRAEELDLAKVEEARERARKALEESRGADEVATAGMVAALEREMARIRAVQKHRMRGRPTPPTGA